jgi:hypothetical protein
MRPPRNSPCPCGSGLKYKRCHEADDVATRPPSSGLLPLLLLALLITAGAAAVVIGIARAPAGSSASGRVWSEEHKHWHNQGAPAGPAGEARSAPGTPPPGKVWSPEHGHWHDVAQPTGSQGSPPPIGITYGPSR